jgi:hypothetical protein
MAASQTMQIHWLALIDRTRQHDLSTPAAARTVDAFGVPGVRAVALGRHAEESVDILDLL